MHDNTPTGQRVALYARVSTEEQREGQTIDSQVAELKHFAQERGLQITGIYKDDGWSGGVMGRPELDRLRDDARKGVFQAVLINDVDRLARDVAHLGVIKRDLERTGVTVVFRKLPVDKSPTYNLMVNILGSFAEFEREMIADRTRRGRRHKVETRKQYLGSISAYGYRYTPKNRLAGEDGVLQIVPLEAGAVKDMFRWVDEEGLSARRVVQRLNETSIPTRSGSRPWARSSVLRILRNEMYAGVWYYNKHEHCEPESAAPRPQYRRQTKSSMRRRPREEWLPLDLSRELRLVPRDQWERVQKRLDMNRIFSPRNEKHKYLLKGLVRCGGCNARYVGDPCHGKYYYRCYGRCKRYGSISENTLNDAVVRAVETVIANPHSIVAPLRILEAATKRDSNRRSTDFSRIERDDQGIVAEEARLLEAYRTGVLSPRLLGSQLELLSARRNALLSQRKDLETAQEAGNQEWREKSIRDYCATANARLHTFSFEQLQQFLRVLVISITFYGQRATIKGHIPIEHDAETSQPGTAPYGPLVPPSRIESTGLGLHGHNPTEATTTIRFDFQAAIEQHRQTYHRGGSQQEIPSSTRVRCHCIKRSTNC